MASSIARHSSEEPSALLAEEQSPGQPSITGSKRKRVSLACNACRLRKSKCNGVRPKCGMCRDLDFDCVYQQSASSANTIVGKDYIGRLETRLLAVEELLAASLAPSRSPNSPNHGSKTPDNDLPSPRKRRRGQISEEQLQVSATCVGDTVIELRNGHLEDDAGDAPDTVVDGMGAVVVGDEEDYGYFGPSSNIAFIGHVTRALATTATVPGAVPKNLQHTDRPASSAASPSPRRNVAESNEFESGPANVNMYILPAESQVRHFISLYFQNTNILFPYLHQPSFLETYEAGLKTGFSKVRRTWLALLNIAMAMGSRSSTEVNVSTEEKYRTAEIFYQRGYALMNCHLLRLASLDAVHVLLLMSHYLQSTRKPVQCWTTHGLAIRVAIQMGLHSNQALQRFAPLERELRKRAWYGCVLLDRTLCMTFGRPSAIGSYADKLDLPLDLDDSSLRANMSSPPAIPPIPSCTLTTFFILSIKLYTLLGSIISSLYGGNLGGADPSTPSFNDVARIAEIEEKLSLWRQSFPSAALKIVVASEIPEGGGPPSSLWRQSIILSLRYYNTRSLLHRQFTVKGLSEIWGAGPSSNQFEGDFFWNFGLASIKTCSDSAIHTIEIVHKVRYRSDLLGFWWFTLYYTFNASLVLVSKVLIVSQVRQLAHNTADWGADSLVLLEKLEMAMETLEVLATNNRIANRCREFLRGLLRYVRPLAMSSPRTLHAGPAMGFSAAPPRPGESHPFDNGEERGASFKAQMGGEFMLESDFGYLQSMLPSLSGEDMPGGFGQSGFGLLGGFGG